MVTSDRIPLTDAVVVVIDMMAGSRKPATARRSW
jgi:hypothetical protein